jgi:hypothetical protein
MKISCPIRFYLNLQTNKSFREQDGSRRCMHWAGLPDRSQIRDMIHPDKIKPFESVVCVGMLEVP